MAEKHDPYAFQRGFEMLARGEHLSRTFFLRRDALERPVWEPPVDVYESQGQLFVLVALPGVESTRVEVHVRGNELIVTGERSRPAVCKNLEVRQLEIPYGRFERRVALRPGLYEVERREFVDGCLLLLLAVR